MLRVKILKKSSIFLLIGLLVVVVEQIVVNLSYFGLNSELIDNNNGPNHFGNDLRSFGEVRDGKRVEVFNRHTWVRAGTARCSVPEIALGRPRRSAARHLCARKRPQSTEASAARHQYTKPGIFHPLLSHPELPTRHGHRT